MQYPMQYLGGMAKWGSVAATKLRVRSALNPILFLCAIEGPICIFGAWLFSANYLLQMMFAIAALAPLATACVVYVGFAIRRPELLQSEGYQLDRMALLMTKDTTGRHFRKLPGSAQESANPYRTAVKQPPERDNPDV